MDLQVQQIDERVYDALGIISRQGFRPRLQEGVSIVVSVPLNVSAGAALGFNDGEVDADRAFWRGISVGAVGAQFSHSQIYNVPSSGLITYVDRVLVSCPSAGDAFTFFYFDTVLTTLDGTLFNKRRSGPNSTTQARKQNNATQLGTGVWGTISNGANVERDITFNPAVKLTAGQGFGIFNSIVNVGHVAFYEIREYAAP